MQKKIWIDLDAVVLVNLRDFSNSQRADIIHKYEPDEVRHLRSIGTERPHIESLIEKSISDIPIIFDSKDKNSVINQQIDSVDIVTI